MSGSLQDIPTAITETLSLLAEQRHRMEQAVAEKPGYNAKMQKPLSELANALRALSSEARQWANQVAENMASATPEQKTEVALAWLTQLPVGARVAAYTELARLEAASFERLALEFRHGT